MTDTEKGKEMSFESYQDEGTSGLKSEDQVVNIDIVKHDFNDFVEFMNNEFQCRLLTTDLFGFKKQKDKETPEGIKVEVDKRE